MSAKELLDGTTPGYEYGDLRRLQRENIALTEQVEALRSIGEKLLAIFDHPTRSVTIIEQEELRAALASTSTSKEQG